jgi:hypothetical protein
MFCMNMIWWKVVERAVPKVSPDSQVAEYQYGLMWGELMKNWLPLPLMLRTFMLQASRLLSHFVAPSALDATASARAV